MGFCPSRCPPALLVNTSHSARSITGALQNEWGVAEEGSEFTIPSSKSYPKRAQNGTVNLIAVPTPASSGQDKVLFKQAKLANVLQRQKAFGTSNTEEPHATSQGEFRR